MESDNRNAPAFSQHPGIQIDGPPTDWLGLTKREWFAGQLMPHLLLTYRVEDAAKLAASAADALISALETKP